MKQTFNLLSEVLALPFSELFFEHDFLAGCIKTAQCKTTDRRSLISALDQQIDQLGPQVAGYINLHTTFTNTATLQNMVNYVYRGEDIVGLSEQFRNCRLPDTSLCIANHYSLTLIHRISNTFLTSRNGKAVFKYWPDDQRDDFQCFRQSQPAWTRELLGSNFELHRVEAWHSLLRCLPESFLLSSFAAQLAERGAPADPRQSCVRILLSFGDTVHIADVPLDKVLDKGLAETHLHAGAARSFDMNWENILYDAAHSQPVLTRRYAPIFQPEITCQVSQDRAQEALIARVLLAICLQKGETMAKVLKSGASSLCSYASFARTAADLALTGTPRTSLSSAVTRLAPFLESLGGCCDGEYLARLLGLPYAASLTAPGFGERCLLAWSLLHVKREPEDVEFTALFLYYLRLKNYFYRCRTQDSKESGLLHFQHFYAQSTDRGSQTSDENFAGIIYAAIRDRRVRKIELRMTPPFSSRCHLSNAEREIASAMKRDITLFIRRHIYAVILLYGGSGSAFRNSREYQIFLGRWNIALRSLRRGRRGVLQKLLLTYQVPARQVHPHRIGIIYHFVKQGERNESDSCFLHSGRRQTELEQYAAFSFGRTRFQCQAAVAALTQVRQLCPEISRLIVGLDAASIELTTDPWVFAPAFRQARELDLFPLCKTSGPEKQTEKRMLGLTYHVGEEFLHPLSGLRHLSEAIDFYALHAGDRLGHGLALGIDPERWFATHGLITIPRMEWLEDCLWAWEIAAREPTAVGSSSYVKFLESEIMSCANAIYGTLDGITVEKLARAYHRKTLGFQELSCLSRRWADVYRPGDPKCFDCLEHKGAQFFPCAHWNEPGIPCRWDETSLTLSHHCRYYKAKMAVEMMWEPDANETGLAKALQAHLRRKVAERGIILEENPSSNAVIGEVNGILSHPICHLRETDSDGKRVIATVNTDDPSVFHTNVANEHALVYFALIHQGYSVEDALSAVDELRRVGLESSFLVQVPPFEQLLDEYETILSCLL